jgi:hypothetical protein
MHHTSPPTTNSLRPAAVSFVLLRIQRGSALAKRDRFMVPGLGPSGSEVGPRYMRALPTVGDEPRKLIAIRLDAKVLSWLRKTAEKTGKPYHSRKLDRYAAAPGT